MMVSFGLILGLVLAAGAERAVAVDASALRDKLTRFYKQEAVGLRTEQRRFSSRQGRQSLKTRQRLEQKFLKQRLNQAKCYSIYCNYDF